MHKIITKTEGSQITKNTHIMEPSVHEIARILFSDAPLINNWSVLSDNLGLKHEESICLEKQIQSVTTSHHQIFEEILRAWLFKDNEEKTVKDFSKVLRDSGFHKSAEILSQTFTDSETIKISKRFDVNEFTGGFSPHSEIFTEKDHSENFGTASKPTPDNAQIQHDFQLPISFGLLLPTKNFLAREGELSALKRLYRRHENLVLITGLGGIGKTELCKKFVQETMEGSKFHKKMVFAYFIPKFTLPSCIWLHGETNEKLNGSIQKLASKLGLDFPPETTLGQFFENLIKQIFKHDSNTRIIVIIDNLDSIYDQVNDLIKKATNQKGVFVIVTSRNKDVIPHSAKIILDTLEQRRAKSQIKNIFGKSQNNDADLLCSVLSNFPLALTQAVGYVLERQEDILNPNYTISDYLREFNDKKYDILEYEVEDLDHPHAFVALVVWKITLRKLTKYAMCVLKVLSYLDPDGVDVEFLKDICEELNVVENDFIPAVFTLMRLNLIHLNDYSFSIHRLIQKIIKQEVLPEFPKTLAKVVVQVFKKRTQTNGEANSEEEQLAKLVCTSVFGKDAPTFSDFIFETEKKE